MQFEVFEKLTRVCFFQIALETMYTIIIENNTCMGARKYQIYFSY
jgi:hypothetical protein